MATSDPAAKRKPTAVAHEAAPGEHPPRLDTGLWRHLKTLLLLNILPIAALAWIALAWHQGKIAFRTTLDSHQWLTLGVILGSCAVIAVAAWVVLPVGRWLRDYPLWHYRRSPAVWLLPMLGGHALWAGLCLVGFAAMGGALAVIGSGAYYLWAGHHGG